MQENKSGHFLEHTVESSHNCRPLPNSETSVCYVWHLQFVTSASSTSGNL